jgi:hypothetical protein
LRHAGRGENIVLQLLLFCRGIYHKHRDKKHPLVAGLEIVEKRLRLLAVGDEIGRQHVHIIPGADCLLLLLDPHFVQIRQLALDRLYRLGLVDGLNVHIDRDGGIQVEEISEKPVGKLRRHDLQK